MIVRYVLIWIAILIVVGIALGVIYHVFQIH